MPRAITHEFGAAAGAGGLPAFGATPILDNFNRANQSPPSAAWTQDIRALGAGDAGLRIQANLLRSNLMSGIVGSARFGTPFGADQEVYATQIDGGAFSNLELWARMTNPNSAGVTGYLLYCAQTNFRLQRYGGGGYTTIGTIQNYPTGAGNTLQDNWAIGLRVVGSTLSVYFKPPAGSWALAYTLTDATYPTGSYVGLLTGDQNLSYDDFGGGAVVAVQGSGGDALKGWYANELEGGASAPVMIDGNVTPANVRGGRYAAQVSLSNPQKRCELVMGDLLDDRLPMTFADGERWQFSWDFKLSATWNNVDATMQAIAQWFPYPAQNFSGSAPVALLAGSSTYGLASDLQLAQAAGQPAATQTTSVPLSALAPLRGAWTKIRVIIDFSVLAAKSRVAVILNGAPVLDARPTLPTLAGTGPSGTADRCTFKVGYFRDTAIASSDSIIIASGVDARQL